MKNNFYKLLSIILITLMLFSDVMVVFAENRDNIGIIIKKHLVTVQGATNDDFADITIQVIRNDDGKRVYIDQLKTNESGQFSVTINLEKGSYKLIVGFTHGKVQRDFSVSYEDNEGGGSGGGSGGNGGNNGGSGGGSRGGSYSRGKVDDVAKLIEKTEPHKKAFSDIEKFYWAKEAIEAVAAKGILLETADETFSPEANITRGDFIGALIRALGLTAEAHGSFIDVSVTDPYYEDIKIARALGIAKGVGDDRLDPYSFITRQDMMVLIERALRISGKLEDKMADLTYLDQFEDKDQISGYAREAVALMVELGFIQGDGKNVNPKGYVTRAEAAVVLYRICTLLNGLSETIKNN
ncbi:S-layer homology domain-containing protein [Lutispora thermophila]|uniref:S-layer homology domain-containing protein n=1 Tax=Lutispora thermophila DSM 19022 TaxID=1122184 RepID=A0A1M6C127_9FIRM|nr:S-layer homology domain-containing protein [Lutispora thermophila]SHI54561.1 S-layer homology domain-containing protein [Lutispora thermophila DSM 19022]